MRWTYLRLWERKALLPKFGGSCSPPSLLFSTSVNELCCYMGKFDSKKGSVGLGHLSETTKLSVF